MFNNGMNHMNSGSSSSIYFPFPRVNHNRRILVSTDLNQIQQRSDLFNTINFSSKTSTFVHENKNDQMNFKSNRIKKQSKKNYNNSAQR